jgi:phosphoribosylformimino-5-aminoimidazole carboxamide ribotide isomerase
LGTAALQNLAWFEDLVQQQDYRGHIVLGLDARAGKLAVSGWQTTTDASVLDIAALVSTWPLAAIVYTDIAVDCMMQGPNLEATAELARNTNVPVIASGGIATLDDLRALRKLPLTGAIVGRALYDGAFSVAEALAVFE